MSYNSYVLDEIGRKHPRKNLYLLSLSQGEKVGEDHPYLAKLKAYQEEEKKLSDRVAADLAKETGPAFDKPILKKLHGRLVRAQKMQAFYKDHIDLTYDAEYWAKVMSHEISQIPEILDNEERLKAALKEKENLLSSLSEADVQKADKVIVQKTAERQKRYEKDLADLNEIE